MGSAEAVMADLSSLTKLSKTLNEKSNQSNKLLQDLERKLVAMNLGVEVWLMNSPLTSLITTVSDDSDDEITREWKHSTDEVLGFGRFGDKQALLVKTIEYDANHNGGWDIAHQGRPQLLLSASRELRVKALEKVKLLLDELEDEAKKIIESIQEGKSIIDKL